MSKRPERRPRVEGAVTVREFRALEAAVAANERELSLQFKRMAQLQAELDAVKQAWVKLRAK